MKNCGPCKLATLAFLIVVLMPVELIAQDARIKKVTAKTGDGLVFSAWVKTQTVSYNHNIVVLFKVTNSSAKTIYLVHDNASKILVDRDSIVIPRPIVLLGGHEGYDYSFTKVAIGKTYYGRVVISRGEYQIAQPWPIDVGFGYVSDIAGLNRGLGHLEDPAPLKGLLNSRLETLRLCGIRVEVVDTHN